MSGAARFSAHAAHGEWTHAPPTRFLPLSLISPSLNLYLDVINLFLMLLRIFGNRR